VIQALPLPNLRHNSRGIPRASCGKNSGICVPNCLRCGAEATTLVASGTSRKRPSGATSNTRRDGH